MSATPSDNPGLRRVISEHIALRDGRPTLLAAGVAVTDVLRRLATGATNERQFNGHTI